MGEKTPGQQLPHAQRRPDSYRPSDDDLLAQIRQHPLITLLELCLCLWHGVPWRAPEGKESLTATPHRFPGTEGLTLTAAEWVIYRLQLLHDQGLIVLDYPCCTSKRLRVPCLSCQASVTAQALSPLSIDEGRRTGPEMPEQTLTATVQVEGRRPVILQLCGTMGRVLRQTARGLRSLGGAHLRADDVGLELVAPGLDSLEIAACEDYLQSQDRPRLPPDVEALVAALPALESGAAVHDVPRCPKCLTLYGQHGPLCPLSPSNARPANDIRPRPAARTTPQHLAQVLQRHVPAHPIETQGNLVVIGVLPEAMDAALDRREGGHA